VQSIRSGGVGLILDLDPELGRGIAPEDWELARNVCRGAVAHVPRGRWQPPHDAGERGDLLGLVMLEGILCREVVIRDRHLIELLGPGDVLNLPVLHGRPQLGSEVALTATTDLGLVGLGDSFTRAAARWPCMLAEVHRRLEAQRERLAVQAAIAHLPRAEHRVLLVLRHLADRWGQSTHDGTVIPILLTHDVLGQLAAARRSTASLAVASLERENCLHRREDGAWLLTHEAELRVEQIARTRRRADTVGMGLMLRALAKETRDEARALRGEAGQIRAPRRATARPSART
jgi:CRP/FNR family transcriptional regulator, cyclic AMP receptor protein